MLSANTPASESSSSGRITAYTYNYDENGLRTRKTIGSTVTDYYYNGTLLIGIVKTTTNSSGTTTSMQRFSYDADGKVIGVNYNGTYYYYLRNAQGDIVKLIDKNGNAVVEYTYDTWGKLLSTTGSLAATFGKEQPFRYRGYIYDEETGFYYLQSRYYDPEVRRFISADVYLSTGQGVLGHNAYAYCLNNPVNFVDSTGHDGELIDIGRGWFVRIDNPKDGNRHIHIWNKRKNMSYSQNDDGSPHDKGKHDQGKLPRWLQKAVKAETGWDYNGNRDSFYKDTSVVKENGIYIYHFVDGTEVRRLSRPLFDTVRSKEKIYYDGSNVFVPIYSDFELIPVLPLIGEFGFMLPAFGFGLTPLLAW